VQNSFAHGVKPQTRWNEAKVDSGASHCSVATLLCHCSPELCTHCDQPERSYPLPAVLCPLLYQCLRMSGNGLVTTIAGFLADSHQRVLF
jgi:hypothetical protein